MKVVLYAVPIAHRKRMEWHWEISIHMEADFRYWFEQHGVSEMITFQELPIGTALLFKQILASMKLPASCRLPHVLTLLHRRCSTREFQHYPFLKSETEKLIAREVNPQSWFRSPKSHEYDRENKKRMTSMLAGRALLPEEFLSLLADNGFTDIKDWPYYMQMAYLHKQVDLQSGLAFEKKRNKLPLLFSSRYELVCRRCGSKDGQLHPSDCAVCQTACYYCRECIVMGRMKCCSILLVGKESAGFGREIFPFRSTVVLQWQAGRVDPTASVQKEILDQWNLSDPQAEAAKAGIDFLRFPLPEAEKSGQTPAPCFLIWAVTGAGKTEMIFPIIDFQLQRGGNVLIATPRKDVVLELQPRLQKAFPQHKLAVLYGGSGQRWAQGDITLATTHQLLRFWHAFDLVIIDEVDALPNISLYTRSIIFNRLDKRRNESEFPSVSLSF